MISARRCLSPLRWLVVVLVAGAAMSAELPKGSLIEKVACGTDEAQTYALYLPTGFNVTRRWPVLFCFDPGGRGRVPVEHFMAAAEKFGYIVAGSNNSRNGPWEANAAAVNAMIRDVDAHLPLDAKRVYVAGLSGGARVACQVAMTGIAQGVVACSAGFMGNEAPEKIPFAFFGTAGTTDFNYLEMRRLERELDDRRVVHRIVFHDGGHEWLSPELALEALAWLDLQAMRTGATPRDETWILSRFEARVAALPAAPAGEVLRAVKSVAADFRGLVDTAEWEKKAAELGASREVRDWTQAERVRERREESLGAELLSWIRDGYRAGVKKTGAELRVKSEAAADAAERQMATRVLQGVYTSCSETVRDLLRRESYAEAEPVLEMMVLLRPDRPQAYFDLARCRAHGGDRKGAIASLQQAAAAGFNDAARVEADAAFAGYRKEPAFLDVLSAMRAD
jgi:poly(3-hydroxybutyrate) depolymerase